jgi:hypothetical protein
MLAAAWRVGRPGRRPPIKQQPALAPASEAAHLVALPGRAQLLLGELHRLRGRLLRGCRVLAPKVWVGLLLRLWDLVGVGPGSQGQAPVAQRAAGLAPQQHLAQALRRQLVEAEELQQRQGPEALQRLRRQACVMSTGQQAMGVGELADASAAPGRCGARPARPQHALQLPLPAAVRSRGRGPPTRARLVRQQDPRLVRQAGDALRHLLGAHAAQQAAAGVGLRHGRLWHGRVPVRADRDQLQLPIGGGSRRQRRAAGDQQRRHCKHTGRAAPRAARHRDRCCVKLLAGTSATGSRPRCGGDATSTRDPKVRPPPCTLEPPCPGCLPVGRAGPAPCLLGCSAAAPGAQAGRQGACPAPARARRSRSKCRWGGGRRPASATHSLPGPTTAARGPRGHRGTPGEPARERRASNQRTRAGVVV